MTRHIIHIVGSTVNNISINNSSIEIRNTNINSDGIFIAVVALNNTIGTIPSADRLDQIVREVSENTELLSDTAYFTSNSAVGVALKFYEIFDDFNINSFDWSPYCGCN